METSGGRVRFWEHEVRTRNIVKGLKGSIQGSVHQKPGLEYLSSRYIKIPKEPALFICLFIPGPKWTPENVTSLCLLAVASM